MKKFFGAKKKKKSKTSSFTSADSDYQVNDIVPRKLKVSQSTERHIPLSDNSNTSKRLVAESRSQEVTKPAMAKRLNRATSSPPALVMPRPRYAEPPTRAVLRSYEHEKTQLYSDHSAESPPAKTKSSDANSAHVNDEDKNEQERHVVLPVPSLSAPMTNKPRKVSPVTTPRQSEVRSKKSIDGAAELTTTKKHESLNSMTGSDDSNRVYESALESPLASTSTILDNHYHFQQAAQRHSSPPACRLVPSLMPPTASDSSETVTPAGSTNQLHRTLVPEQASVCSFSSTEKPRPTPQQVDRKPTITTSTPTTSSSINTSTTSQQRLLAHKEDQPVQRLQATDDLESLQQQVKLIQQQREMDRVEYERIEHMHKERTKRMKAEIDRTQSRLIQLASSKRGDQNASQYHTQIDGEADGIETVGNDVDCADLLDDPYIQRQTLHHQHQHDHQKRPSNVRSVSDNDSRRRRHNPSVGATMAGLHTSKSGDSLLRLSRSSSKSSSSGIAYRSRESTDNQQEALATFPQMAYNSERSPMVTDYIQSANVSRQSSDRKSQSSQQHQQRQRYQDIPPSSQAPAGTSRGHVRQQQRPRSKSTDSRPPAPLAPPPRPMAPPEPSTMAPEMDYYPDYFDDRYLIRPPSRPRSGASGRHRYRSHSVERHYPAYYDYPPHFHQGAMMEADIDYYGENDYMDASPSDDIMMHDEKNNDYMDRYHRHHHTRQQQRYDSFPPPQHRQQYRHAPSYHPGSMPFFSHGLPPPPPPPALPLPPFSSRSHAPPSRINMDLYRYDNPPSPYYSSIPPSVPPPPPATAAVPPSLRRRQQQHQPQPSSSALLPSDDSSWQHSSNIPRNSSFNRYPHHLQPMPAYMPIDELPRHSGSYWRTRPPPAEFTI